MAGDPNQVKRTIEIEEITNLYVIHPISRMLVTVFAKLGIHPNLVSLVGIVFGVAAAFAYHQYARWEMALLGFVMMIGWHIMDGADGQLARMTGKTSEMGKALDGLVDHLSFALVYIGLTLAAADVFGNWVWWLAVAAGVSHLVQATTYEYQRQMYDYWVFGKETARPISPEEVRASQASKTGFSKFLGNMLFLNLSIQKMVAVNDFPLYAQLEALKQSGEGARAGDSYRSVNRGAVKTWSVLSSNYRTIAIFVACLAGNPLYFFLFEIGFLNGALVFLSMMQVRRNRQLLTGVTIFNDISAHDARAAA